MAEEPITVPKVEEIQFGGELVGTLNAIQGKIASMPFYTSRIDGDELTIARVESRNISKKPYLFYMIKIGKQGVKLVYSIPPDTSERMRRAAVIKDFVAILSLVTDSYRIDQSKFYQYIDSVMDNLLKGLSENYSSLFNKYDALLMEYRELKRLNLELSASNRNLTVQSSELNEHNRVLEEQVNALQKYSDGALMAMVGDWIEVHNNTIDINEFSKTYGIVPSRVEQILDKMVSQRYLEIKE